MTLRWINDALRALPGCDDVLIQKVWAEKRLLFDGRQGINDIVDYHSARLVVATLRRKERLMVTLPDFQPYRSAFLFTTALIRYFLDSRGAGADPQRNRPVLYFGATVGIRDHLLRTNVLRFDLNLADVFSQEDVSRGAAGIRRLGESIPASAGVLPHVVTVYAPADAVAVLRAYNPCWVAVDCDDASSLLWLRPLLQEASQKSITVIAWGQNPLSGHIADFAKYGHVFSWPPNIQSSEFLSPTVKTNIEFVLHPPDFIRLVPFALQSKSIGAFSASLRDAGLLLARTIHHMKGTFEKDAAAVHWKYLRSLEALATPVDFYEAEVARYWGLRSFSKLRDACGHFRSACMDSNPRLYDELEAVAVHLDEARTVLESHGCPMWDAVTNLCLEDPADNEIRLLVFTSESRKQLFLFAMLARYNTSEDDLRKMRTYVVSLFQLRRWEHLLQDSAKSIDDDIIIPSRKAIWHPVLVGLPSPIMTPSLMSTLLHPKVDVLLYPHQASSFMRRYVEWSVGINWDVKRNVNTLAYMSDLPAPHAMPSNPLRLVVNEVIEVNIETTAKAKMTPSGPLWTPIDAVSEVARIFQPAEESSLEDIVIADQSETSTTTPTDHLEEIWSAKAIKVQFDQGWHAYFAEDDMVNVIQNGALDQRYVRSLRVGERVMLIHGQQRQNLYDLIISRVHRHPSIELHIALIQRWHADLRMAFEQWRLRTGDQSNLKTHDTRDLNSLLRLMQTRGSQLVSTLALHFWLRGLVLCPLDGEDLRRVAEILDMGFVRQHYRRIIVAARRLKGLHISLSRKLNRWLQDYDTAVVNKGEDDMIDAELGLTFGDIMNSLLVLQTIGIETVSGPFLRSNLGRAEKEQTT